MAVRFALAVGLSVALVGACSSEPEPTGPEPECKPNQFVACLTTACNGVRQCSESGFWGQCNCTVLDASYPETTPDSPSEAEADATPGG